MGTPVPKGEDIQLCKRRENEETEGIVCHYYLLKAQLNFCRWQIALPVSRIQELFFVFVLSLGICAAFNN